jgi:alcohol dehydrogenase class IV
LTELGVPRDTIPEMAKAAMNVTRLMANNPREMTAEDVEGIYEKAV